MGNKRVCRKCQEEKDFSEFKKRKDCVLGIGHVCLLCHNKDRKERYKKNGYINTMKKYKEKNKDVLTDYQKIYKEKNKDTLQSYQKEYTKKWRSENKDKMKDYQKNYYIENKNTIIESHKKYNKKKGIVIFYLD